MNRQRWIGLMQKIVRTLFAKPARVRYRAMAVQPLDERRVPCATPAAMDSNTNEIQPMQVSSSLEENDMLMRSMLPFNTMVPPAMVMPDFWMGQSPTNEAETTDVSHFELRLLGDAQLGEHTKLLIAAMDDSNQLVTGYTGTIEVSSSDSDVELPDTITFENEDDGMVLLDFVPNSLGEMSVLIEEAEGVPALTELEVAPEPGNTDTTEAVVEQDQPADEDTVVDEVLEATPVAEEAEVTEEMPADESSDDPVLDVPTVVPADEEEIAEADPVTETDSNPVESDTPDEVDDELIDEVVQDQVPVDPATPPVGDPVTPPPVESSAPVAENAAVSGRISFEVSDAPVATRFLIRTMPQAFDGEPTRFLVTALDASNSIVPNFTGTVTFSTDAAPGSYVLPADYFFTEADYGTHLFSARFDRPGEYSVRVKDTASGQLLGEAKVEVVDRPARMSDMLSRRFWRRWRL